ncbi:hypothetical protein [Desulfosporosinus sp.]|uniref:hypothetical protein n=1 Tax=Desulfosporosinus sp. TaxID=157907 RepID=UPI0025B989C2|nr:hypothetical protein [Desulfosporosinus sp.]MBC2729088.1 hypothetical protein [Desulfosporosinus sp.]
MRKTILLNSSVGHFLKGGSDRIQKASYAYSKMDGEVQFRIGILYEVHPHESGTGWTPVIGTIYDS